jgi:hypothetical protein
VASKTWPKSLAPTDEGDNPGSAESQAVRSVSLETSSSAAEALEIAAVPVATVRPTRTAIAVTAAVEDFFQVAVTRTQTPDRTNADDGGPPLKSLESSTVARTPEPTQRDVYLV